MILLAACGKVGAGGGCRPADSGSKGANRYHVDCRMPIIYHVKAFASGGGHLARRPNDLQAGGRGVDAPKPWEDGPGDRGIGGAPRKVD